MGGKDQVHDFLTAMGMMTLVEQPPNWIKMTIYDDTQEENPANYFNQLRNDV